MRTRVFFILVCVFLFLALTGCYTVLRHPQAAGETGFTSDYYDPDECSTCHIDDAYYTSNSTVYYSGYRPWVEYYQRPWWYDAYWGDDWYYDGDGGWRPSEKNPRVDRGGYPMGGGTVTPVPSHDVQAGKSSTDSRQEANQEANRRKPGTKPVNETGSQSNQKPASSTSTSPSNPNIQEPTVTVPDNDKSALDGSPDKTPVPAPAENEPASPRN